LERFTINWALYDTMNSKNKQTQIDEEVVLSKEMQKKLKLIEKAFH
jgi:hypothetical protein